ncbi:hypothetical protein [Pedobacter cryotolerans]|uniref:Uncharacterized protein n=1 Tax=Pedobacter cryotolerans TaxID=2571270 RepID=A0A4U1C0N6_9SPHI|nr:hypothetical protein [Pedobacter cryotolerans]TKB96530.1 hypothetical protein FA045_17875 [Pedobacter cryotolerans]
MTLLYVQPIGEKIVSIFLGISFLYLIGYVINYFLKSERLSKILSYKYFLIFIAVVIGGNLLGYISAPRIAIDPVDSSKNELDILIKKTEEMGLPFSEQQRLQWAECVQGKVNLSTSSGSTPDQSLINKAFRECEDFIFETQTLSGWTPKFENRLYLEFVKKFSQESKDSVLVNQISKCVVNKIKQAYPNGIDMVDLKKKMVVLTKDCF